MVDSFVADMRAEDFAGRLPVGVVDLILTDPPYFNILPEVWDRVFPVGCHDEFAAWLAQTLNAFAPSLKPNGSLLFFGGLGRHGAHPFWHTIEALESLGWTYRNVITWKKRRAYGKSKDYLFCREEIAWLSRSNAREEVTFNIPLLAEKRGYDGWNPKHKAKSEFKRVSNVWTDIVDDIPELMRPRRPAEKPVALLRRFVETHSNPGDIVVDPFCGTGSTLAACMQSGRTCWAADIDPLALSFAREALGSGS